MQTQKVKITLPKGLIKRMDALVTKYYRNRAELIEEALRRYLLRQKGNLKSSV